ncbi:MAG TPA: helix-turn-helix transcriptional regulator [Streptosporangiaceae bacterium]|jgi:DNA-binding PadR family transcriptional regulator
MSPVFRHGRLRLYLLKLLDEAPRHGYEIIRLLQDRFLGVYAPSPGTIYPRLARLEEEGLVTHDEADGRKVYRITEKGREELRSRLDDLAELEDSITASVRDIAREVSEDVRETVRSLREELASAVRDVHTGSSSRTRRGSERTGGQTADAKPADGKPAGGKPGAAAGAGDAEQARLDAEQARLDAQREAAQARLDAEWDAAQRRLDAVQERLNADQGAAQARLDAEQGDAREEHQDANAAGQQARAGRGRHWGHGPGADWGDWSGWSGWAGRGGYADPRTYRDLDRMAKQFTRDLRSAAWQAQAVSEDAVHELRVILDEAIGRIKDEVFGKAGAAEPGAGTPDEPGPASAAGPRDTGDPAHQAEDDANP